MREKRNDFIVKNFRYCNFKKSSLRKMTVIKLEEESESLASAELAEFFNSRRVSQNSMAGVFKSVDGKEIIFLSSKKLDVFSN